MPNRSVVLFGIQPTGFPHFGNYLGLLASIKPYTQVICCIADLHALTSVNIASKWNINLIAAFAIAVLMSENSFENSIIYTQSSLTASTYLNWINICLSKQSDLERASSACRSNNLGRILYPCLMASDILLCRPNCVAVGLDQNKHIEYVKSVVHKLNSLFQFKVGKKCVLMPNFIALPSTQIKVMSLQNPIRKMSKSDTSELSTLNILDTYYSIKLKLLLARTDCISLVPIKANLLHNRIGLIGLLNLYASIVNTSIVNLTIKTGGINVQWLKTYLYKLVYFKLRGTKRRLSVYLKTPEFIDKILSKGNQSILDWSIKNTNHLKTILGLS